MRIIIERKKKDNSEAQSGNTSEVSGNPIKPKKKLSKEKIIIIVLSVILIGLALFVLWDLYGKKISFNCSSKTTNSTSTTANSTTSTKTTKKEKATAVDASLYASCTAKISDEKVYKSCCDALTADDTVKKACKKVVDDKSGTTTPTNTTQ